MDYSLPVFSVYGILQARIPKWEPFPSPGGLPDPGIEPMSPTLQANFLLSGASLVAQLVKNSPAMQETPVQFLGWEDPLKKEAATHSSILA